MSEPNDWQSTTPDNLPTIGQVVEVRWNGGDDTDICEIHNDDGETCWLDRGDNYHARQGTTYEVVGTEWRPVNERMDKDGCR